MSRNKIERLILSEISLKYEADTPEYLAELDELISSIRNLKDSLRTRSRSNRHHRKEAARLQSAIEAVKYLKKKSERRRLKILAEGGAKIPQGQGANLVPEIVVQSAEIYKDLMSQFNTFLDLKNLRPVKPIKPVGSTAYYQEDLAEDTDVVYGDIDYLVSLPPADGGENLAQSRKSQNALERQYSNEFLSFLQSSPPEYVDVGLTGETSPTMVVITLPGGEKVQIDLIATSEGYEDWMQVRWVPERGVKGYVGGNLYKAFGDALTLTVGDEGVLARIKDGKRVTSRNRGKDISFIQVSTNPNTFFKDIAEYLSGPGEFIISQDLEASQGVQQDNITITGIASGIRAVAESLEENNSLPENFKTSAELLEEILARFKLNLDATIDKKAKNQNMTDEKLNKLVKMNSEQYNNVKNEFNF